MITRVLVIFLFFTFPLRSFSQIPERTTEEYCIVRTSEETFSTKYAAEIDLGSGYVWLTDSANNKIKFKSLPQILNHVARQGWKLFPISEFMKEPGYSVYLFRRERFYSLD